MDEPVIRMPEGLRGRVEQARDEYDRQWKAYFNSYQAPDAIVMMEFGIGLLATKELLKKGEIRCWEFNREFGKSASINLTC